MKTTLQIIACLALASALANTALAAEPAASATAAIDHAFTAAGRLPGDAEQDARRKAPEILALLGVKPGMQVIDAFAAGGYYSELLSRIVGPEGKVIAYNNPAYAKYGAKKAAERYAGARLPNVEELTTDVGKLGLAPASVDAALLVMSYHDLYWRPKDGSWPETDPKVMLGDLHAALKPGAVVVVQDHVAIAGSDPYVVVDALHRIDPVTVRRDFELAGFVFDGESAVLAHPDDDHTKLVFDPAVQGKTDQFVYRFRRK
jgi:predicted methyltransferase